MPAATSSSWKTKDRPFVRRILELSLLFSDAESERMRLGFIPKDMDDRWFIFFEEGWLYFYRSWSGDCIYGARLDEIAEGVRITHAWVTADMERYYLADPERNARMIRDLISGHLLS